MSSSSFLLIIPLTFLVAFLYSSVGHGGASGYLALLSLFSFPHEAMAANALILNLIVAGMACYAFRKAGHFSWTRTWPFVLLSIPAAFLGGLVTIPKTSYSALLAFALFIAGMRFFFDTNRVKNLPARSWPFAVSLGLGGAIGLLSGIVGVGGGIFLSPLLLLFGRVNPKETAALSAFFIWVNSLAGLLGRFFRQGDAPLFSSASLGVLAAAVLGGAAGSHLGATRFTHIWLKRILGFVLFIAAVKLLWVM